MTTETKQAQDETQVTKEEMLARAKRWYREYVDGTAEYRANQERDVDYYHADQWSPADTTELAKRGQPKITKNRIAKNVNYTRGQEIRTRVDPKAFPRQPKHGDDANAMTDAIRFVCDQERFNKHRSDVMTDVLTAGNAGVVVGVEVANDDVRITLKGVRWDQFYHDPRSCEPDFSDARFLGVVRWMDFAEAKGRYPGRANVLEATKTASDPDDANLDRPVGFFDSKRQRVKVCELYYKDEQDRWSACQHTGGGFLADPAPSTYLDEHGKPECPLLATSGFVTRHNERYGIVRNLISPQDELNKYSSKAVWAVSTRQVFAEADSLPATELEKVRTAVAQPDGAYANFTPGSMTDGSVKIESNTELAQHALALVQGASQELDIMGAYGKGPGLDASGRAMQMWQTIVSMELDPLFDNLRSWTLAVFTAIAHRVKQFWTYEKWLRVRDDDEKSGFRFVAINRRMTFAERLSELVEKGMPVEQAVQSLNLPEAGRLMQQAAELVKQRVGSMLQQAQAMGQQPQPPPPEALDQMVLQVLFSAPQMQQVMTQNDITQMDVDIILDVTPDTTTIEQEEYQTLAQVVPQVITALPQTALDMMEILIESSQMRSKPKILKVLERAKQPGPGAQLNEQMQQLQATMAKLQAMLTKAEVEKTQAQTQEQLAKAALERAQAEAVPQKTAADVQQSLGQALVHAANAGEKTAMVPGGVGGPMQAPPQRVA